MRSADIAIIVFAFLSSAALTGIVLRLAKPLNLLDVPNQRSSHSVTTPRGGGLGFVLVCVAAVAVLYLQGAIATDVFAAFFVGGLLIAGIGFVDDFRNIAAGWRLTAQFATATFALSVLGGLPEISLGDNRVDLGLFGDLSAIVFTVWLTNLYNFMDGIDGIAASEAIFVAASAYAIASMGPSEPVRILIVVFAAAMLGFLLWNWPPARIFMGDVGSGFVGFVLAMFAITTSSLGMLSIWSWLILAAVFVVDATITLLTRILVGEKWHTAHRSHAYQKAATRLNSHRQVTLAVLAINLVWLLPLAWVASARPEFGWWLMLVAWAPVSALAVVLGAGRPRTKSSA